MKRQYFVAFILLTSLFLLAQSAVAAIADPPAAKAEPSGSAALNPSDDSASAPAKPKGPDRAAAYYHFCLAHMYEEQVATYGRSDLATKAIEEYRAAIDADPNSPYLTSGLAELYAKTGRIRDAVIEAQDIIKKNPNNLEARRLLGRIYLRSLGDMQAGNGSDSVLKLAIEQYEQIVRLEPDSTEDHLLLGRLYRFNNDITKAEGEFKTAVKLQPDSEEAVTTLAYLYNELGETSRAAEVLSSVPKKGRSAKLYSALGYTYEQQKQYKNAVDAYRHAIELDRDNLDAIRGLAENLLNDGQSDAALEQYKVIADANPEDAQTYIRIAEIYRKQGKFDLALENLKKAQSMVQDSIEVPYNIASIYHAQGRYDDAVQIMRDLLKKTEKADGNYSGSAKGNRAVFLERLGTIYRDQGNYQAANETFRQMIALGGDENSERAYQQVIDTWREAKEWQKATDVAKEAVQKLPNSRDLKMVLAAQQADMGEADKALKDVSTLLKGNAEDRQVYITLAQMNTRLRRFPDAEQNLDKAEQLSNKDDDKEYVWFLRGSTLEREKRYSDAEVQFKKVLASDPAHASALNYLGYMLADQNMELEAALGYIKRAVDLDPANGAYLDSLGWVYFRLGKYDLAEENLLKASQKINTDPTVHDHLGDLYQKTGRLKMAVTNWDRALNEWNRTIAVEVDPADVARVQKKVDSAKVKLAREDAGKQ
ncbi:MAG TPA: tetratricopeptide repeat protein [Terriglobales bacterium]|nr:tetratricopeptide repeat protein [Terriglobales bacterium]